MDNPSNKPSDDLNAVDYAKASEFAFRFQRGGLVHLVGLKEDCSPVARTFDPAKTAEAAAWIGKHNRDRYNIYFQVNRLHGASRDRKAAKADMASVQAFHVDVDVPGEEVKERLLSFSPKPSVVLFSGGGWQAFWSLAEPFFDFELAEAINAALAHRFGGDNCQNIDRIMRVPETINWPNNKKQKAGRVPTRAYLAADCDFSRVYDVGDFASLKTAAMRVAGPPAVPNTTNYPVVSIKELGLGDEELIALVEFGDDLRRPRGGENPRFPSRSEAYFSVACTLARHGMDPEAIAGVLVNPRHGISEAILEKRARVPMRCGKPKKPSQKSLMGGPTSSKTALLDHHFQMPSPASTALR